MGTYVAVMGTMGCGKTTASRLIAENFGMTLLEENFGDNAFLSRFYTDMNRWAFHSQTFYLMEKLTQLLKTGELLSETSVVQDTPIVQDVFSYAKAQHVLGHIDDAEWRLYMKIYSSFAGRVPVPDLIIYLDTNPETVIARIGKRGRSYEQNIPSSYIELLDMLNLRYLSANRDVPVVRIDAISINFARSKTGRETFLAEVRKALPKRFKYRKI